MAEGPQFVQEFSPWLDCRGFQLFLHYRHLCGRPGFLFHAREKTVLGENLLCYLLDSHESGDHPLRFAWRIPRAHSSRISSCLEQQTSSSEFDSNECSCTSFKSGPANFSSAPLVQPQAGLRFDSISFGGVEGRPTHDHSASDRGGRSGKL